MNTSHTPWPWHAVGWWVEHPDDDTPDICNCHPASMDQYGRSDAEICANARLIAVAPELLACLIEARDDVAAELQRCRDLAGYPSTDRRLAAQEAILARIDAAIISATGGYAPC